LFKEVLNTLTSAIGDRDRPFPRAARARFFRNIKQRGFDPGLIIDVGSNMGRWTQDAMLSFPDCQYILLEPQIEMKAELDRLCARARDARWILAGAGRRDGEMELAVRPEHEGSGSSFMVPAELRKAQNLESRPVPIYSLDSICKQAGRIPDLVKLDAEGMEMQIMAGAKSLIGVTEIFLLEVALFDPWPEGPKFPEVVEAMNEFGYVPYDFTEFVFRPWDGALGLVEIAFSKQQGVLRGFTGWG